MGSRSFKVAPTAAPAARPGRPAQVLDARTIGLAALLFVVTCAVFAPVRHHEFVLYDDLLYVTGNPRVQQGVTGANLRWALTATAASNWHPLTWWSHMLDCQLFGMNAGGHHVTSVLLHAANAALLLVALALLTGEVWRSAFVAGLFALHPLHVESVAYVAERKDVLSGLFWMATLIAYARYADRRTTGRYLLVCVCFLLGLMAKPMLVTLPCVLLLLDVWPLRRLGRGRPSATAAVFVEKIPLFVLAAAVSAVTFLAQRNSGAVALLEHRPLSGRIANAVLAYGTYLGQMLWPVDLSCFYPYPASFDAGWVAVVGSALLAVSVAAVLLLARRPYVFVGWCWYVGTLVPVIGLLQVGEQARADRFTYLPLIGVFLVVAWGSADLVGRTAVGRRALPAGALIVLGLCLVRTRDELAYWKDSAALFEHAIAVTERNHLAHNNLGLAYRKDGRTQEAMDQFTAALQASPGYAAARNHLGLTQRDLGRKADAVASFQEAIHLAPEYAAAHFNLGETRLDDGDYEGAAVELRQTLRLNPDHVRAHLQLSRTLTALGRPAEAIVEAEAALQLDPRSPEAHTYRADGLVALGKPAEGIQAYERALQLRPDFPDAQYNLGNALAQSGDLDGAMEHYRRAIASDPGYAEAHNNLGRALQAKGQLDEALAQYSEAIRLAPTLVPARRNRSALYRQLGKPELAAEDDARAQALGSRAQP